LNKINYESATPNPSYLIKSISEQGYSLETSLADLIDNSLSADAKAVEILVDAGQEPFTAFIADDGQGMNEEELRSCMQFPSASPDNTRRERDLGRFGLGMKTASFSQTHCLTVLSRKRGSKQFHGRSWNLKALETGEWRIIINTREEIEALIDNYQKLSGDSLATSGVFEPNTVVVWSGLRKFEQYLRQGNRRSALQKELSEVTADHLSLVFHRFMNRKRDPIEIRLNNRKLEPFDPFPKKESDLRSLGKKYREFAGDVIHLEGCVLPARSMDESSSWPNKWTTRNKSLTDMEGLYVYRQGRLILYGGWNGIMRKDQKLQLARMRVEIGNKVDHLFHLNVAKSQVIIPHDLKKAFEDYAEDIKKQARMEFHNRGSRQFIGTRPTAENLLNRIATSKGNLLQVNKAFPILRILESSLTEQQQSQLRVLLGMLQTALNKVSQNHQDRLFVEVMSEMPADDLARTISALIEAGVSLDHIKNNVLPNLGISQESIPREIFNLLEE
jgi:hypothetical protein